MMDNARILIVDDDTALLQALPKAVSLRIAGMQVDTSDSALQVFELIQKQEYDAIVSDIKMPGMDGLALLSRIQELRPDTPILLITGHGEHDLAIQALRAGAYDFIQKPIDRDYIVAALRRAIQTHQMRRQLTEQQRALEQYAKSLEETVQARTRKLVEANATKDLFLERILAMATTDPVTALPNHRALLAWIDQELERAQRYERACSLLFLDLDHFKALNDGYGHVAGDAVLYEFACLIRTRLRRMDTVGRWGGEEFVVILPEMHVDEALALAEVVRAAVAAHVFNVGGGLHLTCSVGMASYPAQAQTREGLLSAADHAMYGAKRFGRNQVRAANDPAVLALFSENPLEERREEAALVGMVEALVTLVEARDYSTGRHSQQVADLALQLALAMELPALEAQMIALAGRLHDVGKVAIPDAVLQKPGRLTEKEWALMWTHPLVGADVVSHIPALRPLAPVIRAHHEWWDGQGYPNHLKGEAIPLGARILAVVDAYLAMTVDRPYREARAPAAALAELHRCAGSQFDPYVVEAVTFFLQHHDQRCELGIFGPPEDSVDECKKYWNGTIRGKSWQREHLEGGCP